MNAHCQSPLCNPSRASLMTGRRPSSTGIYGLAPWFRNVDELKGLVTLPQHFMASGYRTYCTGKIYHGGYGRKKTDVGVEWHELGPGATGAPFPRTKLVNTPQPHKPAPNSAARILIYENGKANWVGKDIAPDEPIPEI